VAVTGQFSKFPAILTTIRLPSSGNSEMADYTTDPNTTFTALSAPESFTVVTSTNSTWWGFATVTDTTGAQREKYAYGEQVVFMATPSEGCQFVRWLEDGNGDNPRTVTVTQDTILTAVFAAGPAPNHHQITFHRNPEDWGAVSGAGEYASDTEVEIRAIAARGCHFVQWQEDGNKKNPRRITVTEDVTYTAVFAAGPAPNYRITLHRNPEDWGVVSGAGEYASDTEVKIRSTANAGYQFVRWEEDGNVENPRRI
jgi:hypothetical protein